MSLLGAAEIRALAAQLDLKPAKALGQNFVIDANICRKIVKLANVTSTDVALEIGPGLGSLTLALLIKPPL
jgi:16S rRNA (adenine1518-N6/adenine1519-N6)-dimethyltransferase